MPGRLQFFPNGNFRNEATHERSFEVKDSKDVRSKTFEFIKINLGLRTV